MNQKPNQGILLVDFYDLNLVCNYRWLFHPNVATPNPFAEDCRKPRKPYVTDHRKRNEVLKQSFSIDKVPHDLDAIIIGSGIGGMSTGRNCYL